MHIMKTSFGSSMERFLDIAKHKELGRIGRE